MRSLVRGTIVAACLLGSTVGGARAEPYGWTISGSSTDPFVQTGAPAPFLFNLWLWLVCDEVGGAAAAEFDVVVTGDLLGPFSFNSALPSMINAGSATALLFAVGGCPAPPVLAGQFFLVDQGLGGTVCLVPSAANGLNVTVDCSYPQPRIFPNSVAGYSSDGSAPCVTGNCVDPTSAPEPQPASWGRVKGLYR